MIIMSRNSLKSNNFDTKPFYRILFYLKFKPLHRIIHKNFFGYSQNSDNMFCFHKWCELDAKVTLQLLYLKMNLSMTYQCCTSKYINVLENPASGVTTLSEHVTKAIIRLKGKCLSYL